MSSFFFSSSSSSLFLNFFFFSPTIKAVTFRLRGWCVLGVFLLPAFTRLGHECQNPCAGMHARTDWTSVYTLIRKRRGFWFFVIFVCMFVRLFVVFVLGNGIRTHFNSSGEFPSTGRPRGRSNPRCCIMQDSEPNTLPTELFRPLGEAYLASAALPDITLHGVNRRTDSIGPRLISSVVVNTVIC